MNPAVCQNDSGFGHVFYCEFSSSSFARQSADGSALVVAAQILYILHLKTFNKQIVQTNQSHGILYLKAINESFNEVCGLLQISHIGRLLTDP